MDALSEMVSTEGRACWLRTTQLGSILQNGVESKKKYYGRVRPWQQPVLTNIFTKVAP